MKTAIVSGAAGNLGKAVAQQLLDEGYRVYGTVTKDTPGLLDAYPEFRVVEVDLTDEAASDNLVNQIASSESSIDAAVLTVGGFAMGHMKDTPLALINQQFTVNFITAYNVARPVFLQMLKQGHGRIFLTGSRPGADPHAAKGMLAYGLSKSLLFELAVILNDEAKGTNVVTTVIVPGTIDTPQNHQAMPGADSSGWVKPESIAGIISMYLGEATAQVKEPVIRIG